MELVDRYLYAVERRLPKAERRDIVTELADDIASQIEEKQAVLGRPLDDAEVAAVLQSYGHPAAVAARYGPQQSLIGPALFPSYWYVIKIVVIVLGAIDFILTAARAIVTHNPTGALLWVWTSFWATAMTAIGTVTVVFAILERTQSRRLVNWSARSLPAVRETKPIPRLECVLDIVANGLFVIWVLDIPGVRHGALSAIFGDLRTHTSELWATPALNWFLITCACLAVVPMVQGVVNLIHPTWKRLRWATRAGTSAIMTIAIVVLLSIGQFVVPAGNTHPGAQIVEIAYWFNLALRYGFIGIGVGVFVATVFNAYQLVRRRHVPVRVVTSS
jgi:hypothetical protein